MLQIPMDRQVGCLPDAIGKQLSGPCLHVQMPDDVSYLCVMSGSRTLNFDDDDDDNSLWNILGELLRNSGTRPT